VTRRAGALIGRLQAVAAADPARVAVLGPGESLGYGALMARVEAQAARLARRGIAPGQTVGITLREDAAHLIACLALLRLGCRQVTLASHDPPAMRAGIAARLGVAVVLGEDRAAALPGHPFLPWEGEAPPESAAPAAGEGVVVLTSSGTTGRPKLIGFGEAALLAQAGHRAGRGRVMHRPVGMQHNNGKRFALSVLANGHAWLLPAASREAGMAEACRHYGVDLLAIAPHQAEALLAAAGAGAWPARTRIDLTGAPPGDRLIERLQARLTPAVHLRYGATEVGTIAEAGPEDHAADPGGTGRLLPGVAVRVLDEGGRPLPPGGIGILHLRAPGMAQGYLDDAEASARAFRDGWFVPGDMGRLDAAGRLMVAGRADEMMMLGSVNVFPGEIEAAAAGFPGLGECAAFARRSATLGEIPMLAAVPAPGAALDGAALLAHCRAMLGLRAPRRVLVLERLPRNAAGKVLRRDLAALAAAR
jgi:acyl-coenzyme A synthetase/AMP-(fatty) acid ligase